MREFFLKAWTSRYVKLIDQIKKYFIGIWSTFVRVYSFTFLKIHLSQLSTSLPLHLLTYLPVYPSICIHPLYISTHLPIHVPTSRAAYLPTFLPFLPSTCLVVYVSTCLPSYLSTCPFVYLSDCLFLITRYQIQYLLFSLQLQNYWNWLRKNVINFLLSQLIKLLSQKVHFFTLCSPKLVGPVFTKN